MYILNSDNSFFTIRVPILVSDTHYDNCSLIPHLPHLCFVNLFAQDHLRNRHCQMKREPKTPEDILFQSDTRKTLSDTDSAKDPVALKPVLATKNRGQVG